MPAPRLSAQAEHNPRQRADSALLSPVNAPVRTCRTPADQRWDACQTSRAIANLIAMTSVRSTHLEVTYVTTFMIIIIVQIAQLLGNWLSRKIMRR